MAMRSWIPRCRVQQRNGKCTRALHQIGCRKPAGALAVFGRPRVRYQSNFISNSIPADRTTITKLLTSIDTRRELDQYLSYFSSVASQKFAVIKVGGAIITQELDTLVSGLGFLRSVGLFPVVVHGKEQVLFCLYNS